MALRRLVVKTIVRVIGPLAPGSYAADRADSSRHVSESLTAILECPYFDQDQRSEPVAHGAPNQLD